MVLQSALRSRPIPADRVARLMVIGALHVGLAIDDYFTESKPPPRSKGSVDSSTGSHPSGKGARRNHH